MSVTRRLEALSAMLRETRSEVMGPLSAASMESYSRVYPHLVKLHMLQELADANSLLQVRSYLIFWYLVASLNVHKDCLHCPISGILVCMAERSKRSSYQYLAPVTIPRCKTRGMLQHPRTQLALYKHSESASSHMKVPSPHTLTVSVSNPVSCEWLQEGKSVSPQERQNRLRWAERLKTTQASLATKVWPQP